MSGGGGSEGISDAGGGTERATGGVGLTPGGVQTGPVNVYVLPDTVATCPHARLLGLLRVEHVRPGQQNQ